MAKFWVINFKKIKKVLFMLMGIVLTISSYNYFCKREILQVSNSDRLLPIYSVETNKKQVAITFDCAWGADDIPSIIDTLVSNDVNATFFMVGDWIEKYPDAVRLLGENNLELGNHSDSHAHVNNLSYEKNVEDMKACNEKIKELTGEECKFYRGPYGEYNNTVIQAAESLNMKVIQWDIDTLDYTGKTADEMCERIKKKLRSGSIILMHNDTKYTASGLEQIINCIKEEGYEIIPLSELIYFEDYTINHEGRQIKKQ
jgi:polysaccharide deacetylase family sporulation protein PdaB